MLRVLAPGCIALLLVPQLALGRPADSVASISETCADSEFRAFDFWLGRWIVRDSTGIRCGTESGGESCPTDVCAGTGMTSSDGRETRERVFLDFCGLVDGQTNP